MAQKKVNISILQMASFLGDVGANIEKIRKIINDQLPTSTDVLILPEVWTVGWSCTKFRNSAQLLDNSSVIKFLSDIARQYRINIIGGSFITKQGEKFYNTCPVFNREGHLINIYNKNHLYSYYGCDEGSYVSAGDEILLAELDGVKYGISICYDIRFPELYRAYAKAGADILVNCAAWGSKKALQWEVMTKSRAVENQCFMVALTQSGYIENDEYNLGQSRIINYDGQELASIMKGEGIVSSELDLDKMYEFRAKAPVLSDIKDKYEVNVLCIK